MKSFLQRKANGIMVRLFGSIPFKKVYEYKPPKEKENNQFLTMCIDKTSNDSRRFKNYL